MLTENYPTEQFLSRSETSGCEYSCRISLWSRQMHLFKIYFPFVMLIMRNVFFHEHPGLYSKDTSYDSKLCIWEYYIWEYFTYKFEAKGSCKFYISVNSNSSTGFRAQIGITIFWKCRSPLKILSVKKTTTNPLIKYNNRYWYLIII